MVDRGLSPLLLPHPSSPLASCDSGVCDWSLSPLPPPVSWRLSVLVCGLVPAGRGLSPWPLSATCDPLGICWDESPCSSMIFFPSYPPPSQLRRLSAVTYWKNKVRGEVHFVWIHLPWKNLGLAAWEIFSNHKCYGAWIKMPLARTILIGKWPNFKFSLSIFLIVTRKKSKGT